MRTQTMEQYFDAWPKAGNYRVRALQRKGWHVSSTHGPGIVRMARVTWWYAQDMWTASRGVFIRANGKLEPECR